MKHSFKYLYVGFLYAFLYLPLIVLISYSLNDARFSLTWHGATLKWYKVLWEDSALWAAFGHSIFLGLCAGFFTCLLCMVAGIQMFFWRSKNREFVANMLIILIVIPDLVLAVALLIFFSVSEIPLGFGSLLISHITFCIPFALMTIQSRLATLDSSVYYAALDLGASRYQALRKIILPLLMPGLISAFLLCFTLSFDDVVISYFVSGPEFSILPLTIYSLVRAGVTPELNALCMVTFALSLILVLTAQYLGRQRQ